MNVRVLTALVLVAVVAAAQGKASGFSKVVSNVGAYQDVSGGFALQRDQSASLQGTAYALFISSLYGQRGLINQNSAAEYVNSLANSDGGFGDEAGVGSDLESVRNALLAYQSLGIAVPNQAKVSAYVRSLFDKEANFFANSANVRGSIKATAAALQALDLLGDLHSSSVQDTLGRIKKHLADFVIFGDDIFFSFPKEDGLTETTANYYGIVVANYVGFDISNAKSKWVAHVLSMQCAKEDRTCYGGFYSGKGGRVTLEDTAHAVASLHILQKGQFDDELDLENVIYFVASARDDLLSGYYAHWTLALTPKFTELLSSAMHVGYETLDNNNPIHDRIVQGTQLKPVLIVVPFQGASHAGLDVDVAVTLPTTANSINAKLQWSEEGGQYVADQYFSTAKYLGEMKFDYTLRLYVVGVGEITWTKQDVKQIGYGVSLSSHARLGGKEVGEGETVGIGTEFDFSMRLRNQTKTDLISGDFDVTLDVLDSSNVVVHTESKAGKGNKKPFKFSYTLESTNVVAGLLTFRFQVSDARGVHTTATRAYNFGVPMIATKIAFAGFQYKDTPSFKFNDAVKVSMEPATLPDLRTVHGFENSINGKDAASQRSFYMDILSPSGTPITTVEGVASSSGKNSKYSFEYEIPSTFDSVGESVISFRYETVAGESIKLSSYDSQISELYEDANALSFMVNSQLAVTDMSEEPSSFDFTYGSDVTFRFKVKDTVSGLPVSAGSSHQANVWLLLKHTELGRTIVTDRQAAVEEDGEFAIHWVVSPNAVKGAGVLTLTTHNVDGEELALSKSGSKDPIEYNVNIGGDINVEHVPFSASQSDATESLFVVSFKLFSGENALKDADLSASVLYKADDASDFEPYETTLNVTSFTLPVATDGNGLYQVSWSLDHERVGSGTYKLLFFREVDRLRASEQKGRSGEVVPLFDISLEHTADATNNFFFSMEFMATFLLGAAFWLANKQLSVILK